MIEFMVNSNFSHHGGISMQTAICLLLLHQVELAFAASKFTNWLKPLLAMDLRRVAILVVLLRIFVLLGHVNELRRWLYLQ